MNLTKSLLTALFGLALTLSSLPFLFVLFLGSIFIFLIRPGSFGSLYRIVGRGLRGSRYWSLKIERGTIDIGTTSRTR